MDMPDAPTLYIQTRRAVVQIGILDPELWESKFGIKGSLRSRFLRRPLLLRFRRYSTRLARPRGMS